MKTPALLIIFLILIPILLSSCLGTSSSSSTDCASTSNSYSSIQTNILTPKCISCHSTFSTYAGLTAGSSYVVSGNSAQSGLYTVTNSGQMPRGGSKLCATDIAAIKGWIDDKAPNN